MKQQFVTYEIALKLKELGFNEECLACFCNDKYQDLICTCENVIDGNFIVNHYSGNINAPLWQQVIDWFREKYNLNIVILELDPRYSADKNKSFWIYNIQGLLKDNRVILDNIHYNNYYKAREQAILKAIELINDRNI